MSVRMRMVVAAAVVGGMALVGCESPPSVNTVQEAERVGEPRVIEDERLVTDREFAQRVAVIGLGEGVTPGGLRRVEAEVGNLTNATQRVRYRFTWYGRDGLIVRSPLGEWRDATIPAGGRERLTGVAPSREAVDFRLELIGAG